MTYKHDPDEALSHALELAVSATSRADTLEQALIVANAEINRLRRELDEVPPNQW